VTKRRVALVTGSSRGIGAATAMVLAGAGLDLVVTSTRKGGTKQTAANCRALGAEVLEAVYDAADPKSADALVRSVSKRFRRVDVLVNNAGVVVRKRLEHLSDDEIARVLDVNLKGPFLLCRRLLPGMVKRGFGRVVNVSSISATLGTAGSSAYNASKWGLDGLTKSLAEELRGTGVLVASVLPGSVDTDMLKGSRYTPRMSAADVAGVVRYLVLEAPEAMQGSRVEVFG